MPFFQNTLERIQSFLGLSRRPSSIASQGSIAHAIGKRPQSALTEPGVLSNIGCKTENWWERSVEPQKRRLEDDTVTYTAKRPKIGQNDGPAPYRASSSALRKENDEQPKSVSCKNSKNDRDLMPPPISPLKHLSSPSRKLRERSSLENRETFSEAYTQKTKVADIETDYNMEAARRKAAVTQLPANSGTWEPAEQDLFFHLAYRGFEPLLSKNWMKDFATLPLSLFATHTDQEPLIRSHRSTEFRAIKALRELVDVGKAVRDRVMAPDNDLRSEPVIEKAANRYIRWSLRDVGISKQQCIPVHAIASMKPGQSTHDVIRELTTKLHRYSARHRKECDILTSIERNDEVNAGDIKDETRLNEDQLDTDHKLPIIYGLMICSSLIAVFTLSSHTPPPHFVTRTLNKFGSNTADEDEASQEQDDNEDSGLRFIASFDFSDSASDVWNAFVIAILAMMIRKSLLEIYEIPAADNEADMDESVLDTSLLDDEAAENRGGRYVARYADANGFRPTRDRSNVNEALEYDPDL